MNKLEIFFKNQNKIIYAQKGELLSDICERAGYPLDLVCGGKGSCGKCKVTIEVSNKKSEVLACMTNVKENMTVILTQDDIKKDLSIEKKKVKHCGSLLDLLKKDKETKISLNKIKKFSQIIEKNKELSVVYEEDQIIDITSKSQNIYGAAVDIGTTSVVMFLYNISNLKLLGVYSTINKQTSLGADVISRILYSSNEECLKQLNNKIIQTINELIGEADKDLGEVSKQIYKIILCGNSTMQHLFLNLNPENLGSSPFLP